MTNWLSILAHHPLEKLLTVEDDFLTFFVKRDLLGEVGLKPIDNKEINQIIKRQEPNGSWIFKSNSVGKYPSINHDLVETFKSMRILIGKYELDKSHPTISKAANYIFSCQTLEGDIRGILGNQYMPYYCGLFLEYLIKAGYGEDERVEKAFDWLMRTRQIDGGWVIPLQTVKVDKLADATYASKPIVADKNFPSSHLATGMVLRAFAAHPYYKNSAVAITAGDLLKSRFLQSDKYNDRKTPEYWTKFQYPYWWTTLLSSLDTLYKLGYSIEDKDITKAVEWFLIHQNDSGWWHSKYDKGNKAKIQSANAWIAYDICRILKLYLP